MFYNSDISGYCQEKLADGFPASSLKMRDFTPSPRIGIDYRDNIIQFPQPYDRLMLHEKMNIFTNNDLSILHRSNLSQADDVKFNEIIAMHSKKSSNNLFKTLLDVPCDVVICRRHDDGQAYIDFAHLPFGNGWSADEAIGKPFTYFHEGVTTSEDRQVVPETPKFVHHIIDSGKCFERVGAFSLATCVEYFRHPSNVPHKSRLPLDKVISIENILVRFERQVIMSVPHLDGFIFFIHTNFVDMRTDPEFYINAVENAHKDCYPRDHIAKYKPQIIKLLKEFSNGGN